MPAHRPSSDESEASVPGNTKRKERRERRVPIGRGENVMDRFDIVTDICDYPGDATDSNDNYGYRFDAGIGP